MDDSVLGPFSHDEMSRATLGPFASYPELTDERPLHEDMGLTKADVAKVLGAHPEMRELLDEPEVQTLRSYLDGTEKYDVGVLNSLVLELLDGMKARKAGPRPAPRRRGLARRPTSPASFLGGPGSGLHLPPRPEASTTRPEPPSSWWLDQPKR